ncbi:hypothetical protein ACLQ2P_11035 [Actinomadura citrea]|uniref:hypothetical protein n=1 Tax=Actinomadura citrea TaxID=46158 RepID=UPI003CE587D6
MLRGPQMGAALMLGSVVIVGVGFVFTRVLSAPLQGTLGMTVFGGGILVAIALVKDGVQGLDPRKLTPRQRRGMLQHALTSSLMKIGGPIAFAFIGAGPYASITALGSLLAGLPKTTGTGRALRVPIFLAVLIATGALLGDQSVSLLGIGAALAAATHPFNLPSQAKLLGDKRDQGVAQANVICMLVVIPVCFPLAEYLGTPIGEWSWGPTEIVAMLGAGLFATALAAVMQTRAGIYLTKGGMGVWAATAPALQPMVAVALAPALFTLFGIATVNPGPVQWVAFGIVTSTSAITARLDAEAAEAAAAAKTAAAAEETPTRRD